MGNCPSTTTSLETGQTLNVLPIEGQSQSRISFGNPLNSVSVGDDSQSSRVLVLMGMQGIQYYSHPYYTPVFSFRPTISSTFSFTTPVSSQSFLTSSDMRLKQNVETLSESVRWLEDINPVSYQLTGRSIYASDDDTLSKDSKLTASNSDERTQFGFIAQEVREIFPNLVVEDEDGMLAIDYTGFIPLLVDAVKDLSAKVKEQESVISELSSILSPNMLPSSTATIDLLNRFELKQNKPNPFNTTTQIECLLPENVTNALIYVFDLQGSQVLCIPIAERGTATVQIEASSLRPGMYIYSLIADGKEIDSKRMIITE